MKNQRNHVGRINLEYLCLGCGACVPVCPVDAVEMKHRKGQFYPEVDEGKCTDCGICMDVCPGIAISVERFSKEFWPGNKYNVNLGRFKQTYIGYSHNSDIRFNSASGGIATSFICHTLKERKIDGAILTRMSGDNPLRAESFVARTEEDVIRAQTSKYCPTSPLAALNGLKDTKNKETFAFVGLPCQIHGLRKIQERESWARDKIILAVGLFCGHGITSSGTDLLLNKFARGWHNINVLNFRGRGWPGGIQVKYKSGEEFNVFHDEYWPLFFAPYFFTPYRCLTCHDLTSELADISLGDAWLREIQQKDKTGTSLIITRSELAEELLNNMDEAKEVFLQKISHEKVIESQRGILKRKKTGIGSRIKFFRLLFKPVPEYKKEFYSSFCGFFGAFLVFFNAAVSKTTIGQKLLGIIPHSFLRRYRYYVFKLSQN